MNSLPVAHSLPTGKQVSAPGGSDMCRQPESVECGGGLQIWVADAFAAVELEPCAWDQAVRRLGGPIYMSWDWLQTWWQFYGAGCRLYLFVFRQQNEIVGLLPLYVQGVGPPGLGLQVARVVGANIPPKVFDPPLDPLYAVVGLRAALTILARDGCGLLSLGPVSDEFAGAHAGLEAAAVASPRWHVSKQNVGVYTWFPLPESLESYLASLGKNEQKNRRKYELRLLQKECEVSVDVLGRALEPLEATFSEFVRLHTTQWQAEGLPGHFSAWPHGLEYNQALVRAQSVHRRVRLLRIRANGQTICAQYAYAWGKRWFWELPARAAGTVWDRFSLGPTGIVTMIGEAIREGVYRIEGGLGHYVYKLRLGAVERPVWVYRFGLASPSHRMRQLGIHSLRRALQWGYHKLWYRRIMPRLPKRWKRSQWNLWLRYDF